jgi:hypothetical protein
MARHRASKPKRNRPGFAFLGADIRAEIMQALILESEHMEDIGVTYCLRRLLRTWYDGLPEAHRREARARAGLSLEDTGLGRPGVSNEDRQMKDANS